MKSETELAESGMIVGPASQRPAELALGLGDDDVVDAGVTPAHQSELIELPVLVAVGTEPVTRVVVPLVREAHRDAIALAGPHFLDEPVVELLRPLALQEFDDGRAPGEELGA